uniref:OSJNBa0055H05.7 protein n=1 Tax=Oryza sativa subsp. japonica TaxID=39947 RepID=Q7XRD5_ORYSJ|nr:OSJNBa0055H05.7 [Oryza sativa Japonica Group]
MMMPDKKRKKIAAAAPAPAPAPVARLVRVRSGNKKRKGKGKEAPAEGSAAKEPAVYMVLAHGVEEEPTHSVIEVAAGATVRLLLHSTSGRGMSFAAVGTRIVGIGLDQTTVYDPKTSTVRAGCRLVFPKVNPVLVSHGGKLYAVSCCPSVVNGRDFEPWFLVLDSLGYFGWRELPPPPIFPCRLNPLEYRDPPAVRVAAYAIVGSHILLSVSVQQQGQDKGTCAFDMDAEQWEMVLDTNLPFTGQAVPLGDHRFVSCSMAKGGAASVYYMEVMVFPPGIAGSGTGKKELSIVELQVESKRIVPGHLLCTMGKGSFSSFDFRSTASPAKQDIVARIVHRTYSQAEAEVEADDSADTDLVITPQYPGQVFHCLHIVVQEDEVEKRPVTGILTIESGLTSISKIVMEMKYLYEKHKQWDWKVKQVEQKKYLVEFPSKDARRELTRLKGFDFELSNARANVRETERTIEAFAELQEVWVRATGVPPLARSEKVIEKIAHLIGDPMEVDSISLNREAVRVKVLCRDPLKIGGTSEIFLNRVGYRITWNPEGVRQHHQDDPDDPKPAYRSRGRRGDDEEDSQDSHEADKGESKKEEEEKKDTQKREGDHGHKRHKNNEMVEEEEDSLGEGEKVDIPEYIPDISDEAEEVVLCSQGKEVQGINE